MGTSQSQPAPVIRKYGCLIAASTEEAKQPFKTFTEEEYKSVKTLLASPALSSPTACCSSQGGPAYEFDLRDNCPAIRDQGQLGSCVAFSTCFAYEYHDRASNPYSCLFLYYNCRKRDNNLDGEGTYIQTAMCSLVDEGVCPEGVWAYLPANENVVPPDAAYTAAKNDLLPDALAAPQAWDLSTNVTCFQLNKTMVDLLACLQGGVPFLFCFQVPQSFESQTVASTGVFNPAPGETIIGGHAVVCVGYSQSSDVFLIANSWGTGWGMNGYFTMPSSFMTGTLTSSFFRIG